MQYLHLHKAIIAPANPSLGRTIVNGKYFVNGIAITATDFINDPEFPVKSNYVSEILHEVNLNVVNIDSELPENGMMVAEASTTNDYEKWVAKTDNSFALVGAGDFFTALLHKRFATVGIQTANLQAPFLFVAGSAYKEAVERVTQWKRNAVSITSINKYFTLIEVKPDHFVLAINETLIDMNATDLRTAMAATVDELMQRLMVKELFIEGGSTAAAVLNKLNIRIVEPENELSRGVVRMKAADWYVTVKPGSYPLANLIQTLLT